MLFVLPDPPFFHRQDHHFLARVMHHLREAHVWIHIMNCQLSLTQTHQNHRSVSLTNIRKMHFVPRTAQSALETQRDQRYKAT
jgi:hypothetical protein